ncbi:hypothetical protein VNO77_23490 [Canavalia gladiata]|uniref:Uncharacterized protein n=1 Tax=Canavalia gladiata TaxID=3824 RepID=A0AAN9L6Z9_CANGL
MNPIDFRRHIGKLMGFKTSPVKIRPDYRQAEAPELGQLIDPDERFLDTHIFKSGGWVDDHCSADLATKTSYRPPGDIKYSCKSIPSIL